MNRLHTVSVLFATVLAWTLGCASGLSQSNAIPANTDSTRSQQAEPEVSALRDPFWPVGWQPTNFGQNGESDEAVHEEIQWDAALEQLKITGLSRKLDGSYLAIIKGAGIVEKGSMLSVRYASLVYKWRIIDITSEGLVPEQIGVSRDK